MENSIDAYTNYIYITFALATILFIGVAITFVILLVKKSKKDKIKEEKLLEKIRNINSTKCPFCYSEVDRDSIFCKYCGKTIKED